MPIEREGKKERERVRRHTDRERKRPIKREQVSRAVGFDSKNRSELESSRDKRKREREGLSQRRHCTIVTACLYDDFRLNTGMSTVDTKSNI